MHDSQYVCASAILQRLHGFGEPGVILADEVGLGKTYVAYGVAAWTLLNVPRSRILVLTNSKHMMGVWAERWAQIDFAAASRPEAACAWTWEEFRSNHSGRLTIGSYETLKRFSDQWDVVLASLGDWLFQACYRPGTRFSAAETADLKRELGIDLRNRVETLKRSPSDRHCRDFWKRHFDFEARRWRDADEARRELEDMEIRHGALSGHKLRTYDLVIVDEAHRLEARGRKTAMDLLLNGRAKKILYVTATPFALNVSQLEGLLECFSYCIGCDADSLKERIRDIGLADFEKAVRLGDEYPDLQLLQQRLRRWIVRRTWPENGRTLVRRSSVWKIPPNLEAGFISTVALERAIAEMLREASRTHIASRRAGLCSSWAAARRSLKDSPIGEFGSEAWNWAALAAKALYRNASDDSPKIQTVVDRIAQAVHAGSKILVFSERSETLTKLRTLIARALQPREAEARRRNKKWRARLRRSRRLPKGLPAESAGKITSVFAGSLSANGDWQKIVSVGWRQLSPERRGWVERHRGKLILRSVEVFDGQRGDDGTLERFNLPGMPWVLLCSKKGQESIDLHHECNTVVLLDPVWNPAHREQRIGRVHRLNSRFDHVNVVDVYTQDTYEELIHHRANKRAEMMRLLLGAGRWLRDEVEIDLDRLKKYQIDLSP